MRQPETPSELHFNFSRDGLWYRFHVYFDVTQLCVHALAPNQDGEFRFFVVVVFGLGVRADLEPRLELEFFPAAEFRNAPYDAAFRRVPDATGGRRCQGFSIHFRGNSHDDGQIRQTVVVVGIGADLQSHPPMALFDADPCLDPLFTDSYGKTNKHERNC